MLKNNYLMFGNSIMQKYSGMTSRINPLALIFLQNEEEEQEQPVKSVPVNHIRNYFYQTNNYMYSNVVQRYIKNYNQTISVLKSNTLYANSPNFKMNVYPVSLSHSFVQTTEDMETVIKQTTENLIREYTRIERIQEKTAKEVTRKQTKELTKEITKELTADSLKILPGKVREKIFSELTKEVREKILPVIYREKESTVLTKENNRLIEQTVKLVMEHNAGTLPKQVVTEIAAKMTREMSVHLLERLQTSSVHKQIEQQVGKQIEQQVGKQVEQQVGKQVEHQIDQKIEQQIEKRIEKKEIEHEEIINRILVNQIEPFIMAMSQGTSRSVIRQEIQKVCSREEATQMLLMELEQYSTMTERKTDTVAIQKKIQLLIHKIIEHTDTCRKSKEKYERQIVKRLMPLPVRPVNLEFRKEKEIQDDSLEGLQIDKKEKQVLQQKIVQIEKKEQTAESKYYTHFIEKFLKQVKEQKTIEVDRSTLPAGIIYHQKPKETVRFVNKDVISVPLEMLHPSQNSLLPEGKEFVNEQKNVIKNEVVNNATTKVVNQIDINKLDINTAGVSEYVERRVIHRLIPSFTMQHSVEEIEQMKLYSAENIIHHKNGTLELTLLIHDNQESIVDSENSVATQQHKVGKKAETAPMSLVYKREENRSEENADNEKSKQQINAEATNFEQDIVFTKNIVNTQNIHTNISEAVHQQQEYVPVGQMSNPMTGQASVSMAGQTIGENFTSGTVTAVKVERMISESVSKHMNENINEISRQVYRTLERQIKKEQERRGL